MSDTTERIVRLEDDVSSIKLTLGRLEPMIIRIDERMNSLATKAELETARGQVSADLQTVRGQVSADLQTVRGQLGTDLQTVRGQLGTDLQTVRGELIAELARKPSIGAMWTMGIALFALVVAAFAAGAVYLPYVARWLEHVRPWEG